MPYLSFDLDALERVPDAADSAGMRPGDMTYGLLRMWRHCWREKVDEVNSDQLAGFFPGTELGRLVRALSSFGFVSGDGPYRVRGADRYLRITAARSKGGKTASGNLKRGSSPAGGQPELKPGSSPAQAGEQPGLVPGSSSALTANSEQRTANLFAGSAEADPPKAKKPKDEKPADPRHAPLVAQMATAYTEIVGGKWDFDGREAKAVSALLSKGDPPEVLARWRRSLSAQFHRCRYARELVEKWGHHAAAGATDRKPTQPPKQECEVIR